MSNNAIVLSPYQTGDQARRPTTVMPWITAATPVPTTAGVVNMSLLPATGSSSNLGTEQLAYRTDSALYRIPDCLYLARTDGVATGTTGGPAQTYTLEYDVLRNGRQVTIPWHLTMTTPGGSVSGGLLLQFPSGPEPAATNLILRNVIQCPHTTAATEPGIAIPVFGIASSAPQLTITTIVTATGATGAPVNWTAFGGPFAMGGEFSYLTAVS